MKIVKSFPAYRGFFKDIAVTRVMLISISDILGFINSGLAYPSNLFIELF